MGSMWSPLQSSSLRKKEHQSQPLPNDWPLLLENGGSAFTYRYKIHPALRPARGLADCTQSWKSDGSRSAKRNVSI